VIWSLCREAVTAESIEIDHWALLIDETATDLLSCEDPNLVCLSVCLFVFSQRILIKCLVPAIRDGTKKIMALLRIAQLSTSLSFSSLSSPKVTHASSASDALRSIARMRMNHCSSICRWGDSIPLRQCASIFDPSFALNHLLSSPPRTSSSSIPSC
jgi:hypothetical protein